MKTHAVKENRILKSFDSVLIVLTMSLITFAILKSTEFIQDFKSHSEKGTSRKMEFPAKPDPGTSVTREFQVQQPPLVSTNPMVITTEKVTAEETEAGSGSVLNKTTSEKGVVHTGATQADHVLNIPANSKQKEKANAVDFQAEKSLLENWIKNRNDWEQK